MPTTVRDQPEQPDQVSRNGRPPSDRIELCIRQTDSYGVNLLFEMEPAAVKQPVALDISVNHQVFHTLSLPAMGKRRSLTSYLPSDRLQPGPNRIDIIPRDKFFHHWQDSLKVAPLRKFFLEQQLKPFWCWAAMAVSLMRHYKEIIVTQGDIAETIFGFDCRHNTKDCSCDRPLFVHKVLEKFGMLGKAFPNQVEREQLQEQINKNRPVVATVQLYGLNQGHLVVISGWIGDHQLVIWNPKQPRYVYLDFEAFRESYLEQGIWVNTFFTKPPDCG